VVKSLNISERRACRVINQSRSTKRYRPKFTNDKIKIRSQVIDLAKEYGRYGYKRITILMRQEGFMVNKKQVYRIWREEGLKVPHKQPKKSRLWLNDGSCLRLRAKYKNHVWTYDFVSDQTHDGRKIKILNIIDEYSRECLISFVARRIRSIDIIFILADLFLQHGVPKHIRSDNGPEFIAKQLVKWFKTLNLQPLFIEPGSPWENGYIESFNARMRDELLNGEIFYTFLEAKTVIEMWVKHYNTKRPHSSLNYRPPNPEVFMPSLTQLSI
jgi:putative transposase